MFECSVVPNLKLPVGSIPIPALATASAMLQVRHNIMKEGSQQGPASKVAPCPTGFLIPRPHAHSFIHRGEGKPALWLNLPACLLAWCSWQMATSSWHVHVFAWTPVGASMAWTNL